MAKVKIISNPYKKEIRYQRWDSEAKEWCNIDYDNNMITLTYANTRTVYLYEKDKCSIIDKIKSKIKT